MKFKIRESSCFNASVHRLYELPMDSRVVKNLVAVVIVVGVCV